MSPGLWLSFRNMLSHARRLDCYILSSARWNMRHDRGGRDPKARNQDL